MKGLQRWCNKKLRDLKRRWKIRKRRVEWRIKEWVFKVDDTDKVQKMRKEAWLRKKERMKEVGSLEMMLNQSMTGRAANGAAIW